MNVKEIVDILSSDSVEPLSSEFDIEELLFSINGIEDKIGWLKQLKLNRVQSISERIDILEKRRERLRDVITATLESIKKKSLSFPGVGKVVTKQSKGKWNIKNEEQLVAHLRKHLDDDSYEKIVNMKQTLSKKDLNKVLDTWEGIGSLPDSVDREDGKTTLSVSIDKAFSETGKAQNIIENSVGELDMNDFDDMVL